MINNDQNWWITGGYDSPNSIASTVLYDGQRFTPYEYLPIADSTHHLISVNQTHIIYLEGQAIGAAGIFDLTTNAWNNFPPLPNVGALLPVAKHRSMPLESCCYLQRQRRSMPDNSCCCCCCSSSSSSCCCCCCGEKVQNRGLEARYRHGPFHNYCREYKKKIILFNDL